MSSTSDQRMDREEVEAVVQRYHRVERIWSVAIAVLVAVVAISAILALPFLVGLLVALGLVALARAPLITRTTATSVATDADPSTVVSEFDDASPPNLAFQWGLADDVRSTDDGGAYDFSYFFGLQSAAMNVDVDVDDRPSESPETDVVSTLEIVATTNGRSWGTHTISVRDDGGETRLEIESSTDRRFGPLFLVQGLVADRYYADVLAAQGYTVLEREWSLSVL
ncbi:hypothetical protein [Natronorubrum daqingense]|uniref:Uncharacterized protein n=1 Tax=Natronorubrum daqingense TaxID=588898 RepID=A0A1N6ZBD5_9EURY|nr:hypothetical protein [Natronorubrum daqingense]APX95401.1 hypothetical protein BB347_01545 [Natronorubrum daqingense]SIR24124.1 hypothetical protein SAMN05421809_0747 [Natronorubrum daqingense]